MKETLVIMGSHPRTRGQFDFNRQDCDVWVFNEAMSQDWVKRADAVFQLHIPVIWKNPNNRNDPKHYKWLQETTTPVYMQEQYTDVPASVKFPKDEILNMLPNAKQNGQLIREVDCSPAWALALGIYLGYKRIEVYGVELESNTEYTYQQGNFKYWVGVAVGRGIEVDIHSRMFGAPLYGYEGEVYIDYEEFQKRIDSVQPAHSEKVTKFKAAMASIRSLFDGMKARDTSSELVPAVQLCIEAAAQLGEIDGIIQENQRYKGKADTMRESVKEFVFSRQEFEQGAATGRKNLEETQRQIAMMQGQLELIRTSTVKAAKGSPKRLKAMEAYARMLDNFIAANNAYGLWNGVTGENYLYMARLDKGIKAAGGKKSEEAILNA